MKNIKADTLLEYNFISNLRLDEERGILGFVRSKGNLEENGYDSDIFILDLNTDDIRQMTTTGKETSFEFIDEGILFPSMRDEKDRELAKKGFEFTSYYKMPVDGGEGKKVRQLPIKVLDQERISKRHLLFLGRRNIKKPSIKKVMGKQGEERKALIEKYSEVLKEKDEIKRLSEIPFWEDGGTYRDGNRTSLYLYNMETDQLERLTGDRIIVESFTVKNDDVLFIYSEFDGKMKTENAVGYLNLKSHNWRNLYEEKNYNFSYVSILDGEIFVVGSNMEEHGINTNPDFFILKDNNLKKITPEGFDLSLGMSLNTDVAYGGNKKMLTFEDRFYFLSTERIDTYLFSIDKEGNLRKEIPVSGSIEGFQVGESGIYTVAFRGDKLEEIYKYLGGKQRQLTYLNEDILCEYKISTPEYVEINRENFSLDGFIIKPVDFDEKKKYKTILEIHGGPKTTFGSNFFHEMQYLANLGYVVIFTNPRGSAGRGDEFSDLREKYGDVDYDDLMYFLDEMIEKFPFIDEDRLGVTGGSYGGYMTNWIIGHTDRFKGAVTQRSISNWFSKFNITDIGYYFVKDQVGTTPWEDPKKMWDNSPLKYADKVKTPTLIIHSEEDYRCDVGQGYQWFTALKYHGVETEMLLFEGESHGLSRQGRPKQRIKRLEAISKWFEDHI